MELTVDSWRNEMKKYFLAVENLTEKALFLIKRDRIRNHLPFDDSFQTFFLDRTNSRIANAYTNFLHEDRFEDEANDGCAGTSIQHQLSSTIISPESIEQLPIILVPPYNRSLATNTTACTAFVQDGNQMPEQIIISTPLNQSSSVPSETEIDLNAEQAHYAQSTKSMAAGAEPRTKSQITAERFKSNTNKGNVELNLSGSRMITDSTSTKVNRPKRGEPLKKLVTSSIHQQPETIDLTSDQEEAADNLDNHHSGKVQARPCVGRHNVHGAEAVGNSKHTEGLNFRSHDSKHSKCNYSTDDCAATPHINKHTQPADSSDRPTNRATNQYEQRQGINSETVGTMQEDSSMQHPKNDLMSSHQKPKGVNGASKYIDNVGDNSDNSKKNTKLASIEESKKRYKCDYCDYSAKHKWYLPIHIRTHTGELPYECMACNKKFNRKQKLKDHIRTHTNERPYECEVCGKQFNRKQHHNGHMKTHRDLFQFQCSNCRQGFAHEMKWKSHQSRCRSKGFECHLCKKIVYQKHHLVNHMWKHTGEKLLCSVCRKEFSSKGYLTYHMKSHGNLFRFQCSNCRQGFSNKTPWKLHVSRCKSKQFECHLCSRKFYSRKSNLLRHMRRKHTGEKPFGCSDCPKRFCEKSQLTRHTKRCHSNDI